MTLDYSFICSCFHLSGTTAAALVLLEWICWTDGWSKKFSKPDIKALYYDGVIANLKHYLVIGPVAYALALGFIVYFVEPWSPWISFPGTIITQGIGYAKAHRFMHQRQNYWMHKYHHQYHEKSFVRPIAANAVTLAEFCMAYASPLVVGAFLFRPDASALYWISVTVSLTNLLIHTPTNLLPMARYLPAFIVTNEKHFHHHEKNQKRFYSAPLLDFDRFLGLCEDAPEGKSG
ncbi:hypothetical protein CYMTET_8005 [Cymbomonas tetramitiformis]|uniref:Fatty acid hydroxylase domain-containing protein n=1 Tax=Cymbomonas tetramitiformis TaxID=36881 RepID=A0AAE0LGF2_9CHLO|nr:hypothetical protein CYMTET_8005 [Cymbomonas tetramitiformis]|eukprot:gene22275-26873_t